MSKRISKKNLIVFSIIVFIIFSVSTTIVLTTIQKPVVTGLTTETGPVNASILQTTTISLPVSTVSFGTLFPTNTSNTSNDSPIPFVVANSGNVNLDIDIRTNASLFSGTGAGNNTSTFQFRAGNCSATACGAAETETFDWANSINTTWTNFTDVNQEVIDSLKYVETEDEAEIEILISVPIDEPEGNKSSTVTFTATIES